MGKQPNPSAGREQKIAARPCPEVVTCVLEIDIIDIPGTSEVSNVPNERCRYLQNGESHWLTKYYIGDDYRIEIAEFFLSKSVYLQGLRFFY